MEKHEYDKVLALAQEWSEKTKGSALVLMEENDEANFLVHGETAQIAAMLHGLAQEDHAFADMLVTVAGNLIKDKVVDLAKRKDAQRMAYEDTKKAS